MEADYETQDNVTGALARERVHEDLKALIHDAEELIKATAGEMSERAKTARERLSAGLERAKVTCLDLQERGMVQAKAAAAKADTVIRDHPYESLGISFGLGLLIGVLVTRR